VQSSPAIPLRLRENATATPMLFNRIMGIAEAQKMNNQEDTQSNIEVKYRNTLKLNSLAEQPEFTGSDEEEMSVDNISKDLQILSPDTDAQEI
jgi:hypothetical protein